MPPKRSKSLEPIANSPTDWRPQTASLDDPLYYLKNFETVVHWVYQHHADLLTAEEQSRLTHLLDLPQDARALLVRLVMRAGTLFRVSKLNYAELGQSREDAIAALVDDDWVDPAPHLELSDLFRLLTTPECREALAESIAKARLPKSASKTQLYETLQADSPPARSLADWWPAGNDTVIALQHMPLFDRLRLMFFGNLRQSWPDFVLVELGHQRFEAVPFSPSSRAFENREAVDRYLLMHACRERLDAGETPADIWLDVPSRDDSNPWLDSRRSRLLMELGRQAERSGDSRLALVAWADSGHREARLRYLRLLERLGDHQKAWAITLQAEQHPRNDAEARGLERISRRLARKLKHPLPTQVKRPAIPETTVMLPRPDLHSVERAALEHLITDDAPVCYVENTLLNGLFGLLCWPAIYAPLPGSFFHPFHTAPADLHREDFVARRQALFDQCLASLDSDAYKPLIREAWQNKQGITTPFVAWPVLNQDVLELALHCIPARHLKLIFLRLLKDIRAHRSGLPDLIRFNPGAPGYEMIEVKGPGDRLQDHQRRWLEFCLDEGIPVSVLYVRWAEVDP